MSSPRIDGNADLFRTLFQTAPDAMVVVDPDGRIMLANPPAHRLFGYPPEGMPGLRIEQLLPEAVREAHVAHRARYMAHPRVRPMGAGYELTGVRRNGEPFPVEIALSPIGDGLFAASIRDMSETQWVRQALQRARYDTYLARLGKLVLESRRDESARTAVPALLAEALGADGVAVALGLPGSDSLPIRAASGIAPALADALTEALARDALAARLVDRPQNGTWTLALSRDDELPALRAALDSHGFGDMAIAPLLDRHKPTGVLLALTRTRDDYDSDKSHFLQLAANLLAAAIQRSRSEEQLAHAQRLDALGQLTGGIAHDFNNLLTIISGNLQILDAEHGDVADAHELIDSALRAVDRGIHLTRKLLGFSRRRTLTPRALRPQQVIRELGDMLTRTLGARIQVHLSCASDVPPVHADAGELETALVNLSLNARDAMPDGGSLRITARESTAPAEGDAGITERYVAFMVEDTGTGMTREVLDHALDPFFTTKEAGKGSGLGLSMVYGFVKQSGGRLRIESQPGQGTRIELLLPTATIGEEIAETTDGDNRRGHARVLVVEDEPGVRKVAVRFLRSLGYDTLEASSASQAMELLHHDASIQLLFSDVVLGSGHTGFELVRDARLLRPGLPALLASGYANASIGADEALHTGIQLLRKPYRLEQLSDALAQALEGGGDAGAG